MKADEYREMALGCREQAQKTNDPEAKRSLETIAEQWLRLAEQMEKLERRVD